MSNQYIVMIDLHQEARALQFASAMSEWMEHLKAKGTIEGWTLSRRKLNLAADSFGDFMLSVDVRDLEQLDRAFHLSGSTDDTVSELYRSVHTLIKHAEFGLFREFPDAQRVERMGLI